MGKGIHFVPFAKRKWGFLPQKATSGCVGLLAASCYSCYAWRGEVRLVVVLQMKDFIFGFVFK